MDFHGHICHHALDELEGRNGLAKLSSFPCVMSCNIKRRLSHTYSYGSNEGTGRIKRLHRNAEVTPVLDFAEAVAAEQTKANEMVLNVEDAELGSYRQLGFAMKLSKTPAALRKRAPRLGEDTQLVLSQAIADEKLLAEALQSK